MLAGLALAAVQAGGGGRVEAPGDATRSDAATQGSPRTAGLSLIAEESLLEPSMRASSAGEPEALDRGGPALARREPIGVGPSGRHGNAGAAADRAARPADIDADTGAADAGPADADTGAANRNAGRAYRNAGRADSDIDADRHADARPADGYADNGSADRHADARRADSDVSAADSHAYAAGAYADTDADSGRGPFARATQRDRHALRR